MTEETKTSEAVVAKPARDLTPFYIPGAIIIAGVIIAISLSITLGGGASGANGAGAPTVKVDVKKVDITSNDPYIGSKDAPVTLILWSDFQCPFCKAVEVGHPQIPTEPAIPVLIRDYVETGKLRIVFKDFAFLGPDSVTAALFEHSIWKLYPEKFYEWRKKMYEAQDEEHGGFGDEASIIALTRGIPGIDVTAVTADIEKNSEEYMKVMEADREEASKFGITGTPGFITGKVMIPGAVGIDEFRKAIDPQL